MSSTVARATEILELVGHGPKTAQQISKHFQSHPSTIFRLLQTLQRAGFLMRHPDGSYAIGFGLIGLAQKALDDMDLRQAAYSPLRSLHAKVGHTIHLAQRTGTSVSYIDKVESPEGIRLYSRIGRPVRLNCTGVGKAILAHLSHEERSALLATTDWTRYTATTLGPKELEKELDLIAERGWAVDDGEFEDFINCIATPIISSSGHVLGAVSITSLKAISDLTALKEHLEDLQETAADISSALG